MIIIGFDVSVARAAPAWPDSAEQATAAKERVDTNVSMYVTAAVRADGLTIRSTVVCQGWNELGSRIAWFNHGGSG